MSDYKTDLLEALGIEEKFLAHLSVAELGKTPFLPHEKQRELIALAKAGDEEAMSELVLSNGRLVISIAMKYRGVIPLSDGCQEGVLGLIRAVKKYDLGSDYRLSTYASFWIRQAVQRASANYSRNIRLPVHLADRIRRVNREEAALMGLTGMEPGARAVAESLNIPEREVRQAVEARADTIPLDGLNWDDGDEFSQVKRVPSGGDVEEIAAGGFDSEVLNKYLGKINHRLERILRMRFGIDGHEPMTYEEIGNRYGLTRERIRQLCEEGLKSLRVLMARDGLGPGD